MRRRQLKTCGAILLTIISLTVLGQRKLTGFYSSKTADLGFFVTRVQLETDSTFKYEFSGDLAYSKGTGKYRIEGKKIIHLEFDPINLDSASTLMDALSGGASRTRPMKFLYKRRRLYYFHVTTGQLVKKNYLKKRKGRELIFRGEPNASR